MTREKTPDWEARIDPRAPLSLAEMGELNDWLGRVAGPEGMRSLPMLHGFFTALAIGPAPPRMDDYFPVLFGGEVPVLQNEAEVRVRYGALLRFFNRTIRDSKPPQPILPMLDTGLPGPSGEKAWCRGFWIGMAVYPEAWRPLLKDARNRIALVPVVVLGAGHAQALFKESVDEAGAEKLARENLLDCVSGLRDYWRRENIPAPAGFAPIRRNDPCPCGSGKKHKKCCGA